MYRQDLCKMVFFKSLDKNDLKKIEAENQTFSRLVLNFQSLYYKQTKKEIASFEEAVHFKHLFFGGFLTYDTLTCKHEYITAQFCSRHCVGNLVSCLTGLLRMKEKKKKKKQPHTIVHIIEDQEEFRAQFLPESNKSCVSICINLWPCPFLRTECFLILLLPLRIVKVMASWYKMCANALYFLCIFVTVCFQWLHTVNMLVVFHTVILILLLHCQNLSISNASLNTVLICLMARIYVPQMLFRDLLVCSSVLLKAAFFYSTTPSRKQWQRQGAGTVT